MHQTEVPIPSPCPADWNAMTGDARKRFCRTCDKHVHDLSAMTEVEARKTAQPGSCVRYTADRFGRIRHLPAFAVGTMLAGPAFASGMPRDDQPTDGLVSKVARAFSAWWSGQPVVIEPLTVVAGGMMPAPMTHVTLSPTIPIPTTLEVTCADVVRTQRLENADNWIDLGGENTTCTARFGDDLASFPLPLYGTVLCDEAKAASCHVQ